MTVLVPRDDLSPAQAGGQEVYTIDVTGEVLKDGQLWEKYRYRFDYPGDVGLEKLPVVIDRLLRPAEYVSRIKVTDANSGAVHDVRVNDAGQIEKITIGDTFSMTLSRQR
jgi:hypothetical protein